jgi:transcriptional regulator with XRE-family HTH domain
VDSSEIRRIRKKWGKTQEKLAEAIGVDQSQISRWERGLQPIPQWVSKIVDCLTELKTPTKRG